MVPVQQSRDHSSDYHFSSARAIPSKSGSLSGLGSLVYEDPTHNSLHNSKLEAPAESADVVSATSRQSKKAPLPHHYEPSTIAGITIGAFLLIFIGTGKCGCRVSIFHYWGLWLRIKISKVNIFEPFTMAGISIVAFLLALVRYKGQTKS